MRAVAAAAPQATGEAAEARVVAAGLRLLVAGTRAPTGLLQREVVSQATYEAEGRTLRVLSVDGIRAAAALERRAGRLVGGSIAPAGDTTVGGHAAERYRAADGSDVVVWGCPPRSASFVALGDAAVLAHVSCH